jgi:hypothetical protein
LTLDFDLSSRGDGAAPFTPIAAKNRASASEEPANRMTRAKFTVEVIQEAPLR